MGSIHTFSMSTYLPVTPRKIADAAVGAAQVVPLSCTCTRVIPLRAGPTKDPKYFEEFAADVTGRSDVVLNFTTGGGNDDHRAASAIGSPAEAGGRLASGAASFNSATVGSSLLSATQRFSVPQVA